MVAKDLNGIPRDEEFIRNVSTLLGYIVVNCAILEFALNSIIAVSYHDLGGKEIEPTIPNMTSKVVEMLKRFARDLPKLAKHKDEIRALAIETKRISKIRNDIIHGYLADFKENGMVLTFAGVSALAPLYNMHKETVRKISVKDLATVGSDAFSASARASVLAHEIIKTSARKDARTKRSGSIRRKRVVVRKVSNS